MEFLKKNPLLPILLLAGLVRLPAVIWSEGFIHSDDYFDTIVVAWDWLNGGLWGDDGFLRWKNKLSDTIGRFPLYTLFLLAQMKLAQWLGLSSLGSTMYLIRAVHAALSLLPVAAIYGVTRLVTRSKGWTIAAGLVVALHFAFPFLGVRNLIEVVGGNLWIVAIYFIYRYYASRQTGWLYLAGIFTGLAWMIRFQLAFAALPIPFLIWWETKQWRPAIHWTAGVGGMLLLSGVVDWFLLGRFAGSTLTNLTMNTGLGSLYNTVPLMYLGLLIVLMIPPLSAVALWRAGRWTFIRDLRTLFFSSLVFLLAHWMHANQQERFIFPIIPAFLLIGILALWHRYRDSYVRLIDQTWFRWTGGITAGLNLILLVLLTTAYGHKGMIEPMEWLQAEAPEARVLLVQPEIKRWSPVEYGGERLRPFHVRSWDDRDLPPVPTDERFDFFLIYPKRSWDLEPYLDSLALRFGDLEEVAHFEPSAYDHLLHSLNPGHNDNFEAYLCRPQ